MPPPVDESGVQFEEIPARSGPGGLMFVALYLGIGATSIWLAVSEEKARFAADAWRVALGVLGAWIAFLGARGLVRFLNGETTRLTAELHRRGQVRGKILFVIGVALFAVAVVPALGAETIEFLGWTKLVYIAAGVVFVIQGLVFQWNPTRFIRQQRVREGQGRPGVARIVSANDTGASVNDAPQVKIEFELEVGGRTYEVSDKIVMERAKLALLIPGSTVNVLVDRIDPNVFHIDWDSWKGPAAS